MTPVLLLAVLCALSHGTEGQVLHFDKGISLKDTCDVWSTDGLVTLTSGDLIAFQEKVVISANKELCTVDLTACPPANVSTSKPACYCVSKRQNKYKINIGGRTDVVTAGMTLQASVPGYGALENIQGVKTVGALPDWPSKFRATYILDYNGKKDLLDSQTVDVCPGKQFRLQVCVQNSDPNAELTITIGRSRTIEEGDCVTKVYTFSPGEPRTVVFQYKPPGRCALVKRFDFKEDINACSKGTQETNIIGPCPNTPRRIVDVAGGLKYLVDETSENKTWIVIQRRFSSATNFYRSWYDYRVGFGNLTSDFWIGLMNMYQLCNEHSKCSLMIHLQYNKKPYDDDLKQVPGGCYFAEYKQFWLDSNYVIHVDSFRGTAGNSLTTGAYFSTLDSGKYSTEVHNNRGGWWIPSGTTTSDLNRGFWKSLTGTSNEVSSSEMKVRRN